MPQIEVGFHCYNLGFCWYNHKVNKATNEQIWKRQDRTPQCFEESLKIYKKVYGEENSHVIAILVKLGDAWLITSSEKKAIPCYKEASKIAKKIYGKQASQVGEILYKLGKAWYTDKHPKMAILYYEKALKIAKQNYNEDHPKIINILYRLGFTWKSVSDCEKALPYYEQILEPCKKWYSDRSENVKKIRENIHNLRKGWAWQDYDWKNKVNKEMIE